MQCGDGNPNYVVISDPLSTNRVSQGMRSELVGLSYEQNATLTFFISIIFTLFVAR